MDSDHMHLQLQFLGNISTLYMHRHVAKNNTGVFFELTLMNYYHICGIRKGLEVLPPERLFIDPDCGLKTRTVEEAEAKLRLIVEATREVKRELEID